MIDFLMGQIVAVEPQAVLLQVGGVGFYIHTPHADQFPVGQGCKVYTHLSVRDEEMVLYGFANQLSREYFRKLMTVTGIGPRLALNILSAARPEQLSAAIAWGDTSFLSSLPGIGKKTAQRMILELKDKLPPVQEAVAVQPAAQEADHQLWSDVREALLSLGYREAEVAAAVKAVREEGQNLDLDQIIKRALQTMGSR